MEQTREMEKERRTGGNKKKDREGEIRKEA